MQVESEQEFVLCDLCGVDDTSLLALRQDGAMIVACNRCGLAYVNPRVKEIHKFYDSIYFEKGPSSTIGYENYIEEVLRSHPAISKDWRRRLRQIERFTRGRGKLLDVGCATGFFLQVAKRHGWEPYGVDICEYAAKWAKQLFGIEIFTGTLAEARFPNEFFDVVTMWALIEHVPSPLAELKEANRIMKLGGVLAILTPNLRKIEIEGENWWDLKKAFEHLYFFNLNTLKHLCQLTGFQIIKLITEGNGIFLPPKLAQWVGLGVSNKKTGFVAELKKPLRECCRAINKMVRKYYAFGEDIVLYGRKIGSA